MGGGTDIQAKGGVVTSRVSCQFLRVSAEGCPNQLVKSV